MRTPIALLFAGAVAAGFQAVVPHLPHNWGLATSDVLIVLASAYACRNYRRHASHATGRARATMLVGAVAAALWTVANLLFLLTATSLLGDVGDAVGNLAAITAAMLLPVGLVLAAAPERGLAQLRQLIDIAAVFGAVLILAWQFILAPAAAAGGFSAVVPGVYYIVPEALATALALVIAAGSVPGRNARAVHLFAVVAVVLAVTMMLTVHNNMTRAAWYDHGVGAGFVLGAMLLAVASRYVVPVPEVAARPPARRQRMGGAAVRPVALAVAAIAVRLAHQAHHDPLTGLPNRAAFHDRGVAAIRTAGSAVLMLLDLDGFKPVNDSLGHAAGDQALVTVARRLTATLRPDDVVCRLGGDESAVLVTGMSDDDLAALAQRILSTISEPMTIHGMPVTLGVSIGITRSEPGTPGNLDTLLREADAVMYRAKAMGKGTISYHGEIQPAGRRPPS